MCKNLERLFEKGSTVLNSSSSVYQWIFNSVVANCNSISYFIWMLMVTINYAKWRTHRLYNFSPKAFKISYTLPVDKYCSCMILKYKKLPQILFWFEMFRFVDNAFDKCQQELEINMKNNAWLIPCLSNLSVQCHYIDSEYFDNNLPLIRVQESAVLLKRHYSLFSTF